MDVRYCVLAIEKLINIHAKDTLPLHYILIFMVSIMTKLMTIIIVYLCK